MGSGASLSLAPVISRGLEQGQALRLVFFEASSCVGTVPAHILWPLRRHTNDQSGWLVTFNQLLCRQSSREVTKYGLRRLVVLSPGDFPGVRTRPSFKTRAFRGLKLCRHRSSPYFVTGKAAHQRPNPVFNSNQISTCE